MPVSCYKGRGAGDDTGMTVPVPGGEGRADNNQISTQIHHHKLGSVLERKHSRAIRMCPDIKGWKKPMGVCSRMSKRSEDFR